MQHSNLIKRTKNNIESSGITLDFLEDEEQKKIRLRT